MVKSALIEAKKLLDFYIESTDDLNVEQTESVKHFIKALKAGCGCDDYNGFDCGVDEKLFAEVQNSKNNFYRNKKG